VGGLRSYARSVRTSAAGGSLFQMLGGDLPRREAAYVATGAIGLAFVCCVIGAIRYSDAFHQKELLESDLRALHDAPRHSKENDEQAANLEKQVSAIDDQWQAQLNWASIGFGSIADAPATVLRIGYR